MKMSRGMVVAGLVVAMCGATLRAAPSPPAQPARGPGGSDYPHAKVTQSIHGSGATQYWLYEPAEPTPQSARVVVFLHGWGAMNPRGYGAWIRHLTRRGYIVIYPRWQANLAAVPADFAPNAIASVRDAMRVLDTEGHVKPRLESMAIVGHSAGGLIAANLAALCKEQGLPPPAAVMCVQPGVSDAHPGGGAQFPVEDLRKIPTTALLLTICGDVDMVCRDVDARRIFREAANIPADRKDFVTVRSDYHGFPPLIANHLSPMAMGVPADNAPPEPPDDPLQAPPLDKGPAAGIVKWIETESVTALDHSVYWRLFDSLCDAAWQQGPIEAALNNHKAQRDSGRWSDGEPVKPLRVVDKP